MIVNDLRVGNFVYWNIAEKVDVIHEVVGIRKNTIQTNPISLGDDISEYLPIPLTEHWLERFGFRKIKDEKSYCEDGDYTLVSNRFQVFTNDILTYNSIHGWWIDKKQFFIPCQYVHQLQNFHFALTGKELELTKQ